jgi:hypothetical protein
MLKAIQIKKKEDLNPILSQFFLDNISKKKYFIQDNIHTMKSCRLRCFFLCNTIKKINAQVFYWPVSFKLLFFFYL